MGEGKRETTQTTTDGRETFSRPQAPAPTEATEAGGVGDQPVRDTPSPQAPGPDQAPNPDQGQGEPGGESPSPQAPAPEPAPQAE